ncbi:hypothetical protein FHS96_001702 [Sphingomonas zeicaulis]|uniref:hypothetical protein n=1 Tax=Sphingomonas zeicaulis TaxID=1632740 RepID=UPI003D1B7CAD
MRRTLLTGIIAIACATGAAHGQAPDEGTGDAIIVTGTRSAGRAALDSSAPINAVDANALADTGYPDLGRALNFLQPSINFARAATTASAPAAAATN